MIQGKTWSLATPKDPRSRMMATKVRYTVGVDTSERLVMTCPFFDLENLYFDEAPTKATNFGSYFFFGVDHEGKGALGQAVLVPLKPNPVAGIRR